MPNKILLPLIIAAITLFAQRAGAADDAKNDAGQTQPQITTELKNASDGQNKAEGGADVKKEEKKEEKEGAKDVLPNSDGGAAEKKEETTAADKKDGQNTDGAIKNEVNEPKIDAPAEKPKTGILFGKALERGKKKPIGYATIVVEGTEISTETNEKGAFEIAEMPAGPHKIIVTAVGYDKYSVEENLKENEKVEVVYYLEPEVYGLEEIVVKGKKERKEISRAIVTQTELKTMPGSGGDPIKAITNLPGVGKEASTFGLVMRGSNNEDSKVYLDGHPIPILFHFGGLKSVYNSDLLADIEVLTGGFGAEYGGATGGIVNLRSRPLRLDRWYGYLDTSFLDATLFLEGPISDKQAVGVSVRYSLIQYIIQGVIGLLPDRYKEGLSFSAYPNYWDYVARYDHKISSTDTFGVTVFGARDGMSVYLGDAAPEDPTITGNIGFDTMFHNLILTWEHKDKNFKNTFAINFDSVEANFNIGTKYGVNSKFYNMIIIQDFSFKASESHEITIGLRPSLIHAYNKADIVRPPKEGDVYYNFSNVDKVSDRTLAGVETLGIFVEDNIKLGDWRIVAGVRLTQAWLKKYYIFADPRLAVRWEFLKGMTLKSAVGLYQQTGTPDEIWPPWGNPELKTKKALQSSLGYEWVITEDVELNAEGYYKYIWDNIVPDDKTLYSNAGKARIYGFELLLRHKLTKRFFGWLAYSYCKSERKDAASGFYRAFDQDVPHTVTLLLSYKAWQTWQFGMRFQLLSGMPYTPINGSIYMADTDTYVPIYDPDKRNTERVVPVWYEIDLRVDKMWVFDTWILSVYLDVQNVTLAKHPLGVVYNYDYSQKGLMTMFPIIPALGIRAEF